MVSGWLHMSIDLHGREAAHCEPLQEDSPFGENSTAQSLLWQCTIHASSQSSAGCSMLSLLVGHHACERSQADLLAAVKAVLQQRHNSHSQPWHLCAHSRASRAHASRMRHTLSSVWSASSTTTYAVRWPCAFSATLRACSIVSVLSNSSQTGHSAIHRSEEAASSHMMEPLR